MTDPAITAALNKLIADTPPPVTVWGVRYTQQIVGEDADGTPFVVVSAGYIDWCDTEADAREWLADGRADGVSVELVRITGRPHVEG